MTDTGQKPIPDTNDDERVRIAVGDVIQVDPEKSHFGAVLCVVSEVKAWGVQCYFLAPGALGEGAPVTLIATNQAFLRVPHADYVRIGRAEWVIP